MCVCVSESSVCVHAKPSIDSQSVAEATALTQQPYKVALLQTSVSALTGKYQYLQFYLFIFWKEKQFIKNCEKRSCCQCEMPKIIY